MDFRYYVTAPNNRQEEVTQKTGEMIGWLGRYTNKHKKIIVSTEIGHFFPRPARQLAWLVILCASLGPWKK